MTREQLKALGLTDEQIDSVMAEHGKTVNPIKEALGTAESERDNFKDELENRDEQLENLRTKAEGNGDLQATIDALKTANDEAKSAHQKQLESVKLNYEVDQALLLNKSRNPKAVRALIDSEVIKLNEDGKIIGLSEQLEGLKESDPYLFGDIEQVIPPTYTPGSQGKINTPKPKDAYEAGRLKAQERHAKKEEV